MWPLDVIQYFMERAFRDFYQYILSWTDAIHFLWNSLKSERIEYIIPLMIANDLPVSNRIKRSVLLAYSMSTHDLKMDLRMLMATNVEPFLTKQQYLAVLNAYGRVIADDPEREFQQSWNWYSTIFGIQDNAMVTPRSLKHICRYSIRRNMGREKQLPYWLASLTIPDSIKHYLSLTDWEIQLGEEVYLRRSF